MNQFYQSLHYQVVIAYNVKKIINEPKSKSKTIPQRNVDIEHFEHDEEEQFAHKVTHSLTQRRRNLHKSIHVDKENGSGR